MNNSNKLIIDENGVLIIPSIIDTISRATFYSINILDIKKIILHENVFAIDIYTFEDFTNLEEIEIPERVEYIGMYTFYDCINLKKLNILNPNCNISLTAFDNTQYINIFEKFFNFNKYNTVRVKKSSKSFIKFLNEINKDKNNVFKYTKKEILTLKDVDFLLDDSFKGFKEGINYGI